MEVHAHSHPSTLRQTQDSGHRKKWTHYFWEFLMLFLAVFCGFLAENQREHMVEHHRAKEYMQLMLDDLKLDTAEFNRDTIKINKYFKPVLKKSGVLLYSENFSDSTIKEMYDTVPKAIRFFPIIIQESATTQLKNSGNLRLIRNKAVTNSLTKYWNSCNYLLNIHVAGYEATRINTKELISSLFNFNYFENASEPSPLRKNISLKLLSDDKVQFIKLGNYISNLYNQSGVIFRRLKEINQKATDLIALIQKEYHLE